MNIYLRILLASIVLFILGSSVNANGIKMTIGQRDILNARQVCPIGKDFIAKSDRPLIDIYGTRTVIDFNTDGKIDGQDIQEAIDRAYARSQRDNKTDNKPNYIRVLLPKTSKGVIYTDKAIQMKSQVILDGNWQRLLLSTTYSDPDIIRFSENITKSGVYNLEIHSSERNLRAPGGFWIITVREWANNIYIYNNQFINDKSESTSMTGNTNVSSAIHILSGAYDIFIDQNTFSRVPTWVSIINNNIKTIRNIRIKNNWFWGWRMRAIYVQWNRQKSIRGIWIENNRIVEPALGTIRQPIAFSGTSEKDATVTYSVVIRNNYIRASGQPHKTSIDQNTWKKITTSTNGTADMIGIHRVDNFSVIGNCILDAWELWTAIANGSRNGIVRWNYYENTDLAAISVGNWLWTPFIPRNIIIENNIIINPSRNKLQAKTPKNWAFVAIWIITGRNIQYGWNTIKETERWFHADGTPYTLNYAVGVWNDPKIIVYETSPNLYEIDRSIPLFAITRSPVVR